MLYIDIQNWECAGVFETLYQDGLAFIQSSLKKIIDQFTFLLCVCSNA